MNIKFTRRPCGRYWDDYYKYMICSKGIRQVFVLPSNTPSFTVCLYKTKAHNNLWKFKRIGRLQIQFMGGKDYYSPCIFLHHKIAEDLADLYAEGYRYIGVEY